MEFNKDRIECICKKYGFIHKNENEWTFPGINYSDYALMFIDYDETVFCAVDVRDTTDGFERGICTSRIGFYMEEKMLSYRKIENRLKYLKKRIIEHQLELKRENIEKDF